MNGILQTKNPIDSRQLNAFVILVQTGSFAETPRHICLSQSDIGHPTPWLEIASGCRLLNRMGKSIAPTQTGEALLHHAEIGLRFVFWN